MATDLPGSREPAENGSAADARAEEVEVSLPGRFVVGESVDARGRSENVVVAEAHRDKTRLHFAVRAGTTYLVQLDPLAASAN